MGFQELQDPLPPDLLRFHNNLAWGPRRKPPPSIIGLCNPAGMHACDIWGKVLL